MKKKQLFIYLVLSCILFSLSCTKKEEEITPFWKIMQGSWAFDKNYTINGEVRELTNIEVQTVLSILPNEDYEAKFEYFETRKFDEISYEGDFVKKLSTSVVSNNQVLKLYNPTGLYVQSNYAPPYQTIIPEILKIFGFAQESSDVYPYCFNVIGEDVGHSSENKFFVKSFYTQRITFVSKYEYKLGNRYEDENSIGNVVNETDYGIVDDKGWYLGKFNAKGTLLFKILSLNSSEMKIAFFTNYYGRKQNGEVLLDKVEFTFKKLGSSSAVITILPFDIEGYSKAVWERFEDFSSSLLNNGASVSTSQNVDNSSLDLTKTNSYAQFSENLDLLQKNKTLSFWINPNDVSKAKQVILSKYKNQYGPYIISLEKDKITFELNDGKGNLQKVQSIQSIPKNSWSNICLNIDDNNFGTLYINGIKDSGGTLTSIDYDADAKILLGTTELSAINNQFNNNFKGYIDEIILFDKILGEGEIYQLNKWHLTN